MALVVPLPPNTFVLERKQIHKLMDSNIPEIPCMNTIPVFELDVFTHIVIFNKIIQRCSKIAGIGDGTMDLADDGRIRDERELVHDDLHQGDDQGREDPDVVKTGADSQTDPGCRPDPRGGRQTADGSAVAENDARAKEGYPGNDLGCDTGRIGALGTVQFVAGNVYHVHKAILRNDHHQRRSKAYDNMCSDARFLIAHAALKTDRCAAQAGDKDPGKELGILRERKLAHHVSCKCHERGSTLSWSDIPENSE